MKTYSNKQALRGWRSALKDDPIPWLLEPENPSARYLTLRHLLDSEEPDSQVTQAREAIQAWLPVREILRLMAPVDFWGRADRPFYGGPVGTAATLNLLAELGLPRIPQVEAACENLFEHGQLESGAFTYDGTPDRLILCHNSAAIRTLVHFGYRGDPRLERAIDYLAARCATPAGLACPYAYDHACLYGIAKALAAFAALPAAARSAERVHAVESLAAAALDHAFDFDGAEAPWLAFGFPLNDTSDLVELCDALARLSYGPHPRLQTLLGVMMSRQTDAGRWIKHRGSRALEVEEKGEPSKWITLRALRAQKHAERAVVQAEQIRLRDSESWFVEAG